MNVKNFFRPRITVCGAAGHIQRGVIFGEQMPEGNGVHR